MSTEGPNLRNRRPAKKAEAVASENESEKLQELEKSEKRTAKPEKPETPEKPKKTRKKRAKTQEDEDDYSPWLDAVRVLAFLVCVSFGLSYLITNGESWTWGKGRPDYTRVSWWKQKINGPRYMTLEELVTFDGSDQSKPVYLSIDGNIFDVSAGRHIYGPGGSYHWFAGVDATRGFVTGCFSLDQTGDLRGVEDMFLPLDNPEIDNKFWTPEQLEQKKAEERREAHKRVREAIQHWVDFFNKSNKYHFVGKLKRTPGWEGEPKPLCKQAQEGRTHRQPPEEASKEAEKQT